MGRLSHKTALITGGTTGIGLATARLFQQEGARVAITGQDEGRVAQAAALLGPGALALQADVASRSEMAAVAQRLQDEFGGLDVLFANAGIAQPRPIGDVDADHLDRLIDVNFKGVVHSVQAMLPLLRNPSSVVLNATTMIERGIAGMSIYSATKAAVRSLARTLSAELVHRGVRVNAVSPGLVETPIYGKLGLPPEAVKAWGEQLLAGVPVQRFGRDDEIAKAVLFLASDDSTYVLGENLLVDGGVASV
jgi:NAD(P)-dependent dehydrogenase (short-subunit alcohol dehydrogenase family)